MSKLPPKTITILHCKCGQTWYGGNAKYCPSGHPYMFTEHTYVLKTDAKIIPAEQA